MRGAARSLWLAGLLACAGRGEAALSIALDPANLPPGEAAASLALIEAARSRLPPAFLARLHHGVRLQWRDDLPDNVHGRTLHGRIGLRRALLADWMARTPDDGLASHPALAALLHELAHVYDRSPQGGLSRDRRLLDLAGWPVKPLRFGLRARRNDFRDRSPDRYELESPSEFVAVNFEHFLLDPGYACRRPQLHRHFARHFDWSPPSPPCAADLPFVAAAEEGAIGLLGLDPARVHRVDYLLAEANERPMSRWGHSMLRLVVCAPGRARGPECSLDLDHHLVLSFRAFVDDVQVSSWRGLTGAYPSRLFVLPLQQVIDEYTKVELRGLQSVPLRLDDGEISGLLERAARVHWSYDGRYYFVGNNCAVETWKLLNDGVPRLSREPLRSITPTGLLSKLARAGIADVSVLDDTPHALREGYRFESLAAYFAQMYAIADARLSLPAADAREWFALPPLQRRPWLSRGDLRATAALLVLEQAALRREEAQAREALKQRFLRGDGDADETADQLRKLLADGAFAGRPALLLPGDGYGLPLAGERERLLAAVVQEDARHRGLRDGLSRQARDWLPPARRARLEDTSRNLTLLGDRLRAMP